MGYFISDDPDEQSACMREAWDVPDKQEQAKPFGPPSRRIRDDPRVRLPQYEPRRTLKN